MQFEKCANMWVLADPVTINFACDPIWITCKTGSG